jgi:hypothetical protein
MGNLKVSLRHLEDMGKGAKSKVDMLVNVDDVLFPVHSLLLSRRSPLLEEIFQINLDPSNKDSVKKVAVEGLDCPALPIVTFGDDMPVTCEGF